MNPRQNRRRRLFIEKRVQTKMIAIIDFFMLAVGLAGILLVLIFNKGAIGEATADQVFSNFITLVLCLLMVITILVIITIFYGLRFSHRIVGPIYAFSRNLNWIREGNYSRDLRLRKKDEFQNLGRVFNETQNALRERVRETVGACKKAESNLGELSELLKGNGAESDKTLAMIEGLKLEFSALRKKNESYITES